jgi:hypothetical protein
VIETVRMVVAIFCSTAASACASGAGVNRQDHADVGLPHL